MQIFHELKTKTLNGKHVIAEPHVRLLSASLVGRRSIYPPESCRRLLLLIYLRITSHLCPDNVAGRSCHCVDNQRLRFAENVFIKVACQNPFVAAVPAFIARLWSFLTKTQKTRQWTVTGFCC
ncbi:hypothetical protein AVEN_7730-1 [Araneus ventricosus]|uniref:Uncharacterized protein n=1 Tax=Araneus ventricosus TaxID=182803 RepID=A0A4Y2RVY7_ARAVE|nr:hypothetical protein AVEN_7730-1 [Araneus ventricosus]